MNNHIAIEGLDGVGKTTIAKLLSNRLHLPFVEKPWSLYTDEKGELTHYLQLTKQWMELYSTQVSSPALTIVLYATADVRYERMYQRDPTDSDLQNVVQTDEQYAMMKNFLDNYQMPYLWIDTSDKDCETIVEEILIYWLR